MAEALAALMERFWYERYGVHGRDVGAFVGPMIGRLVPDHVIGAHVNALVTIPSGAEGELEDLADEEQ